MVVFYTTLAVEVYNWLCYKENDQNKNTTNHNATLLLKIAKGSGMS